MNTEIKISFATNKDLDAVYGLVKELAIFEKLESSVTIDVDYYKTSFASGDMEILVAKMGDEIVGTCIYYLTFSTWKGRMLHLEDFIVHETHRSQGIGQLLFDRFVQVAQSKKCTMIRWQVLDWNSEAVKFYEKNGATIEKEWWNCKIIF